VFYARTANKAALAYGQSANHAQDLTFTDSDYNFFGSVSGYVFLDNESALNSSVTFAQWQARGKDAHSFSGSIESLVVQPFTLGTPDYHLKTGSVGLGSGILLSPMNDEDILGASRESASKPISGCISNRCKRRAHRPHRKSLRIRL